MLQYHQATYIILEDRKVLNASVYHAILNNAENLQNKFLYLGTNGAFLWNQIEKKYKPGLDSELLISNHFNSIYDRIINDNNYKNGKICNIVSLGCGSGEDDISILDVLSKRNNMEDTFSMITVDLSINLLSQGTERIEKFINNNDKLRKSIDSIRGICIDIEKMSIADYLLKSDKKNLFHLLGLTLGNNKEGQILRSIYDIMDDGDWLLLGLDFSAESEILLKDSIDSYTKGAGASYINKFLCNPLSFVVNYQQVSSQDNIATLKEIKISKYLNVKVEHCVEELYNNISDIPDTKSLTRYHIYDDKHQHRRLCDFSHKYTQNGFEKFIKILETKYNIYFKTINNEDYYKINIDGKESSQKLCLLQKIPTPNKFIKNHSTSTPPLPTG